MANEVLVLMTLTLAPHGEGSVGVRLGDANVALLVLELLQPFVVLVPPVRAVRSA